MFLTLLFSCSESALKNEVFNELRDLIHRESGIALTEEKKALLSSRLFKRLRALGLHDETEYLHRLKNDASGAELISLLDVISTNFTSFYREPDHFVVLADLARQWCNEKRELRLWCAAAASGEEPYTIAITLKESLTSEYRVLATDISTRALEKAQHGLYAAKHVENVPAALRKKYFTKIGTEEPEWQVNSELRSRILFRRLNLSRFPYPLRGDLDAIFCRNVMIYFTVALRQQIINELHRLLRPGGFLFLSHCENLLGMNHSFKPYSASVFRKSL